MRETRSRLIAIFVGIAAMLLPAGPAAAGNVGETVEPWNFSLSTNPSHLWFSHSSKCIDDPNFSTAAVPLHQWTCVNQSNELWSAEYVFTQTFTGWRFYRIRNVYSGLCMNVYNDSTDNGARIIQFPCGNSWNEQFAFLTDANLPAGFFWIQGLHSGKVLNIDHGSRDNGASLIQWMRCYCNNEYITAY